VSADQPGIVILGPTASGKSSLGIALAGRFGGEIVSCDALQIYRHMDVGTAKVSPAEKERVPHHMLDVRDPDRDFSAGDYQRQARDAIRDISARGKLPFVVGGTGFYLRALIDGLFDGPGRNEQLRSRLRAIIARIGPEKLHRALARIDPECASKIKEHDGERVIRAYEIYLASGKTMSWWQQQPRDAFAGYRWLKIGIQMPREELYRRINERVEAMFNGGLLDEVRKILEQFPRTSPGLKAIGYRQAAAVIEGSMTEAEAIEETQKESRHYAKRQMTWFRSDSSIVWLEGEPAELEEKACSLIKAF
jgi:tRNA dimethylallyltransferase